MSETLEQHEHAKEAAEGGRRYSALLIAALAAGLALTEQGAEHASTAMNQSSITAADLWAQYQAKSTRANEAKEMAGVVEATAPAGAARDAEAAALRRDADHFENDPKAGKGALASQAHAMEERRDAAHERLEAYEDAAAAFQLGIVLVTASVITRSAMLLGGGVVLTVLGSVLGVLAMLRPEWAAW